MSIFLPWYYFRGCFVPGGRASRVKRVETQNTMVMRDRENYVVVGCAQSKVEFAQGGQAYINEIYGGEDV